MSHLQRQLERVTLYEGFMFENIRRVSLVTGLMKQNIKKCRLASVLHWKEKADAILKGRLNGK